MIRDIKEMFENDDIFIGDRKIKALSFSWWVIRVSQIVAGIGVFYGFYVLMWLALT